jgi:hypothetical protein
VKKFQLFTFALCDGRKVTYGGKSEAVAFNIARQYHRDAVLQIDGVLATRCDCDSKSAHATRQAGWMICISCAGYIS